MPNAKPYSRDEKRAFEAFQSLCARINDQTGIPAQESEQAQRRRKAAALADPMTFFRTYFPHYATSPFGWFHKAAAKSIDERKKGITVLEWPREHAKSVLVDVMMPMYLYFKGEIVGMMVASANFEKAAMLLDDIQAEFASNQLLIHDFGAQASGKWSDGNFITTTGVGFWAFGRGQSPRGTRNGAHRPNYIVVDDIDDKVVVRNQQRVRDAVEWVLEDLYGAGRMENTRLIVAGNRIHKHSILAHLVGDTEPDQPKRKNIVHIKVYAFETARHKKATAKTGRPAWKERYTTAVLTDRMDDMGFRSARREYFHEHHEEGFVFQNDWIHWAKLPALSAFDSLVCYTDPSFGSTKKHDFKGTVLLGIHKSRTYILRAWVRQATVGAMVSNLYDWYDEFGNAVAWYMEANMLQAMLLDDFTTEGELRGYQMPIRGDKRKKPNKEVRIENIAPLFERTHLYFNEAERGSNDMQTLVQQFLGFPFGPDDGPDAVEGGVSLLQAKHRPSNFKPRTGRYNRRRSRR